MGLSDQSPSRSGENRLAPHRGRQLATLEIGAVEVFKGAHSYILEGDIPLNQYDYLLYYCKPFNVKVGDGPIGD